MLRNQKAQAVLELAILGSLIIMAFAIVISTSENYNRQQSYMQQTFRATLYKAQEANDVGAVSTVDYRRMPNVTTPMEIGEFQQFSSGNSVLWSDGKDYTSESKQYFLHNRSSYEELTPGASGVEPNSLSTSSSSYTTNLESDNVFDKTEDGNNINTTKDLNAQDTVGGESNGVATGGALSTGGRYGFDGQGVVRNRNMQ